MARNRLIYLTALLAATVFFGFFYAWFSEFLWLLILALPLLSLLLSIPAMVKTELHLEAPAHVSRGASAQLHLRTRGLFPQPRCRFRLRVSLCLSGQTRTYKVRPDSHHMLLDLPTAHCGLVRCQVDKARICDYLGLFRFPRRWNGAAEILILPEARPPRDLPGITQLSATAFHPKPGGGYSEYHELRDYRPGDSLRQVHWKLTAKTDRAVVREPQEPERKPLLLTLDLPSDPAALDSVLDQAVYLSRWLLESDFPHLARWVSGSQVCDFSVSTSEDLPLLTADLCRSMPTAPGQSVLAHLPDCAWHYHVTPQKDV